MHKIIILEQIVENPNFKPILVIKGLSTILYFLSCIKYISMFSVLSLQQKLKYTQVSVC